MDPVHDVTLSHHMKDYAYGPNTDNHNPAVIDHCRGKTSKWQKIKKNQDFLMCVVL